MHLSNIFKINIYFSFLLLPTLKLKNKFRKQFLQLKIIFLYGRRDVTSDLLQVSDMLNMALGICDFGVISETNSIQIAEGKKNMYFNT